MMFAKVSLASQRTRSDPSNIPAIFPGCNTELRNKASLVPSNTEHGLVRRQPVQAVTARHTAAQLIVCGTLQLRSGRFEYSIVYFNRR